MKYIYSKNTNNIIAKLSDNIDVDEYLYYMTEESKSFLGYITNDIDFSDYKKYKVIDGEIIRKTPDEINPPPPYEINKVKEELIYSSKTILSKYLQNNPLLFSDGKYYSVTQEKQNLLNNAITVYQMKTQLGLSAELKWNSTGEECTEWTLESIVVLALSVAGYVEPLVAHQQSLEVQIKNCLTREELESIGIDYETV